MNRRALAASAAVFALGGCGFVPGSRAAAPASTAAPSASSSSAVAPTDAVSTDPVFGADTASPSTTVATPSAAPTSRPPAGQARVEDFTLADQKPLADPQYFFEAVEAHTRSAKTYRMSSTETGAPKSVTATVDVSTASDPQADMWMFDRKSNDSVHVVVAGGRVYAQLPDQGAKYAMTPVSQLPAGPKKDLAEVFDPFAGLAEAGKDLDVVFYAVDDAGPEPQYIFHVGDFGSRPAYEAKTYSQVTVDSRMRLRDIVDFVDQSTARTLTVTDYGRTPPVQVPPKRLVVRVPAKAWANLGTA